MFSLLALFFSFLIDVSLNRNKELSHQNTENNATLKDEYQIINSTLDSICNLNLCYYIIELPEKVDSTHSKILKNQRVISKNEIKTIAKRVIIKDSLVSLDINKRNRDFILKQSDTKSSIMELFKNSTIKLDSKELDSQMLKQKNVEFITYSEAENRKLNPRIYGKRDSIFNIGSMSFSRVFYSKKHNVGLFHYTYLGKPTCGYTSYVIFSKVKSKWTFKKLIRTGSF